MLSRFPGELSEISQRRKARTDLESAKKMLVKLAFRQNASIAGLNFSRESNAKVSSFFIYFFIRLALSRARLDPNLAEFS